MKTNTNTTIADMQVSFSTVEGIAEATGLAALTFGRIPWEWLYATMCGSTTEGGAKMLASAFRGPYAAEMVAMLALGKGLAADDGEDLLVSGWWCILTALNCAHKGAPPPQEFIDCLDMFREAAPSLDARSGGMNSKRTDDAEAWTIAARGKLNEQIMAFLPTAAE